MITLNGSLTPRWRVYGGYATMNARITSDTTAAPAGRTVGLVSRATSSRCGAPTT